MSLWSGSPNEDFYESQMKRPNEEAIVCPECKNYAKRRAGTNVNYKCQNCKWEGQSTQKPMLEIEP